MAKLATTEKQLLENLFKMELGYVLNLSRRTFGEFFTNDIGIDILGSKYNYQSGSTANRMRAFWQLADDAQVAESIIIYWIT